MNEVFTIAGVAVVSAALVLILKQYKPEYAFGGALASAIILLIYSITFLNDIFDYLNKLVGFSGINRENFAILIRCFGICMVTKIASDLCKDCGQSSIASKVDFAGKSIVFITAMPLFENLVEIIEVLINL